MLTTKCLECRLGAAPDEMVCATPPGWTLRRPTRAWPVLLLLLLLVGPPAVAEGYGDLQLDPDPGGPAAARSGGSGVRSRSDRMVLQQDGRGPVRSRVRPPGTRCVACDGGHCSRHPLRRQTRDRAYLNAPEDLYSLVGWRRPRVDFANNRK